MKLIGAMRALWCSMPIYPSIQPLRMVLETRFLLRSGFAKMLGLPQLCCHVCFFEHGVPMTQDGQISFMYAQFPELLAQLTVNIVSSPNIKTY
jgi:hypothetical protein